MSQSLRWLIKAENRGSALAVPTKDQRVDYNDYINSPEWQAVRREALARAGHRCQVCNRSNKLNVHHRTYEHLGHEEPGDLTVLCEYCHDKFHDGKGAKALYRRRAKGKKTKYRWDRVRAEFLAWLREPPDNGWPKPAYSLQLADKLADDPLWPPGVSPGRPAIKAYTKWLLMNGYTEQEAIAANKVWHNVKWNHAYQ